MDLNSPEFEAVQRNGSHPEWFIRARLKTRQLLLLVALDKEFNIQRAAETIHLSQPAASKILKDLEDAIGVSLFDRLPRGMKPTKYGEIMIRYAQMAVANLNDAHREIENIKSGSAGKVYIGSINEPSIKLLPNVVNIIKSKNVNIKINIQVDTSDILIEKLLDSKLDLVLSRFFSHHNQEYLFYEPLVKEDVCVVVGAKNPLLQETQLSLRNLLSACWIIPPEGSVLHSHFNQMFLQESLAIPQNVVESLALQFMISALEQSNMLAIIATEIAKKYVNYGALKILPIKIPCKMPIFGIITSKRQLLSPAATLALNTVRSYARSIYPLDSID